MFQVLDSRVRRRLIPAVYLRAALVQMAPLYLILQVVSLQPDLVVAHEDISSSIPAWIRALKDPERDVPMDAAQALGAVWAGSKGRRPRLDRVEA